MNKKQAKFCELMALGTYNATEAYLQVYSTKNRASAGAAAAKLLNKNIIQNKINELREEAIKRAEITADKIVAQVAKHAFLDPVDLFDKDGNLRNIHEIEADARAAITGFEVSQKGGTKAKQLEKIIKVRLSSALQALDMLAKMSGIYQKDNEQKAAKVVIQTIDPGKPAVQQEGGE